jgi:hypothetical protein
MRIAAYRIYWTNNRFTFPLGTATYCKWLGIVGRHPLIMKDLSHLLRIGTLAMLPSTQDMCHIRHFSGSWGDDDVFDVIFEQGRWNAQALSPLASPPRRGDEGWKDWRRAQYHMKLSLQDNLEGAANCLRPSHRRRTAWGYAHITRASSIQ